MGLDRTVNLPAGVPAWNVIAGRATRAGLPLAVRMIDGELAFPDEVPPADWREVRVSVDAGMITLRRLPDGVQLVVWGNADPRLMAAMGELERALATDRN